MIAEKAADLLRAMTVVYSESSGIARKNLLGRSIADWTASILTLEELGRIGSSDDLATQLLAFSAFGTVLC